MADFTKRLRCSATISLVAAVIVFAMSVSLMMLLVAMFISHLGPLGFLIGVSAISLSCMLSYFPARQAFAAFRWQIVRDYGTNCLNCGYNLTGLPEPRCLECGRPFEPKGNGP